MRVSQLWRYPIKSMAGESVQRARVTDLGIEGDRAYGLIDLDTDLVLTARRVPELLFAASDDGGASVRLPDGTVTSDNSVLSGWLGRRVELRPATADSHGRYEIAMNDDRPDGEWMQWDGPAGVFHDSTRTRLSIISEEALGDWDVRRFRPNVVVDHGDERDLLGQRIHIGSVELDVVKEIDRCVIVTRPQPGIDRDKTVLIDIHRTRAGHLGVGALVRAAGTITVGDEVHIA